MLYSGGVYDDDFCAKGEINHSVLYVGYGREEKSGIEYFIFKNSWGPKWGEKGFGKLRIMREDDSALTYTTFAEGGYCHARGDHSYPAFHDTPIST